MKEAKYWRNEGDAIRCRLCPQVCLISEGERGFCMIRKNVGGTLYATHYSKAAAVAMDPIEKKPLYHFYPGSQILSVGTVGCNFRCPFCQNWHLVEQAVACHDTTPDNLVKIALEKDSIGISYTYNEPFIWYEFVYDTSVLAKEKGLKNVLVTNGYVSPEPLRDILPYIDALNVDLKSIKEDFYVSYSKGHLKPVQNTIVNAKAQAHVEVTNLLITGLNDTREEIQQLVDWVASVSRDIPLHFSRYFPAHKMDRPPTSEATLYMAYEIAREKLDYVYLGNLRSDRGQDTLCPDCGALLVERRGYYTEIRQLSKGTCGKCGRKISIVC